MSVQGGNQSQYSHLQGTWTFAFTYTASGLSLYDLQTRWGASIDVLSDPLKVHRRNARRNSFPHRIEDLAHDTPAAAHLLDLRD